MRKWVARVLLVSLLLLFLYGIPLAGKASTKEGVGWQDVVALTGALVVLGMAGLAVIGLGVLLVWSFENWNAEDDESSEGPDRFGGWR